ncbi:oxygenase MpaB family protein [Pseudomonas aeruginosa]
MADAERLIERVRRIHESVIGQLPDGTPYSASDPDLLTWVHVAEVSSFLKSYLRYLNPDLPGSEQDRYYSGNRPGRRTPRRPRAVPRDRQQIAAYLEAIASTPALRRTHPRSGADSLQRTSAQHPGQAVRRADAARRRRAVAGMGRIDARPPVQSATTPPDPRQRQAQRTLAALGGAQRFDASSLPAHGAAAGEPLNFRAVTARIPVQRL